MALARSRIRTAGAEAPDPQAVASLNLARLDELEPGGASRFNLARMREDLEDRGWSQADLAGKAHVSRMTVSRFFRATHQTNRTALRLARALGHKTVSRYRLRREAGH